MAFFKALPPPPPILLRELMENSIDFSKSIREEGLIN